MRGFDPLPAAQLPAVQTRSPQSPPTPRPVGVQAEIVIPVRNEERDLAPSVRRLHAYLRDQFPFSTRITIADNGSTDGTWPGALALEASLESVRAVRIERPGRGGALRTVWSQSDADVLAYMDVDLSTDLNALLPLLAPLLSGHSDVAIGTRLARGARVIRGPAPRDHLALLQPAPARDARHRVLRRPVRLQGHQGGQGTGTAAADHRHRVVLRHRAAGPGRTGRAAHPRGPGGLDRRRRLPGQRDLHRTS
jgi:Glycosyl transferase family 2